MLAPNPTSQLSSEIIMDALREAFCFREDESKHYDSESAYDINFNRGVWKRSA